jgi:hypothetical protein
MRRIISEAFIDHARLAERSALTSSAQSSMRIAICFFGVTRNFRRYTWNSIRQSLLAPVAGKDPRFRKYGHFNLVDRINNPRTGEHNIPIDLCELEDLGCDRVSHTDQVAADHEEKFRDDFEYLQRFGDAWGDQFNSLKNCLRQFHSLDCVTETLLHSGERFDLVIYSRVDLQFLGRVKIPKIRPGTLYTPWFDKFHGLNDRFALGDTATMTRYGKRGEMARQYCEETGGPFHAEKFLRWYAQKQNLEMSDLTSVEFGRARANGAVVYPRTDFVARAQYFFKAAVRPFWNRP